MKDHQLNKDAICITQSEFYANVPTHKVETKFVSVVQHEITHIAPDYTVTYEPIAPEVWDRAENMSETCIYATHGDPDYGNYCIANDWPLPDGCINCESYVSNCNYYEGGNCEWFYKLNIDCAKDCTECGFFVNKPQEVTNDAEQCAFSSTVYDMGTPKCVCDYYGFEMGQSCNCTSCEKYRTWEEEYN